MKQYRLRREMEWSTARVVSAERTIKKDKSTNQRILEIEQIMVPSGMDESNFHETSTGNVRSHIADISSVEGPGQSLTSAMYPVRSIDETA
jgi:hypothetical protein